VHEAQLESGISGAVLKGAEISFDTAVANRNDGKDIVVCGDSLKENRRVAERIEAAVGPYKREAPHTKRAGRLALPHFQQQDKAHRGHSFYETDNRKAKKS
jgi:hypothetical protein